ncbi:MAG: class I SAM-dependent methyltransferase [Bacteroidota bacterium]
MEYPEFIARFYDTIYSQIRDGVDNAFFLNEIIQAKGPVLEIGVGTGRFYQDAIKKKPDIFGIDISPAMIHVLKSKIPERFHSKVSVQSITDFSLDKKFDLIIAPFRVFMHLLTTEEQLNALNNVARHLSPGGRFIFDLFIPNLKLLAEGIDRVVDFDGEYEPGKKLVRLLSMHTNLPEQINHVTMELTWDTDEGTKQESWNFDMRYFFRYELEYLIEKSDLELAFIYGDYHKNKLTVDSKEFVVACRKPN